MCLGLCLVTVWGSLDALPVIDLTVDGGKGMDCGFGPSEVLWDIIRNQTLEKWPRPDFDTRMLAHPPDRDSLLIRGRSDIPRSQPRSGFV